MTVTDVAFHIPARVQYLASPRQRRSPAHAVTPSRLTISQLGVLHVRGDRARREEPWRSWAPSPSRVGGRDHRTIRNTAHPPSRLFACSSCARERAVTRALRLNIRRLGPLLGACQITTALWAPRAVLYCSITVSWYCTVRVLPCVLPTVQLWCSKCNPPCAPCDCTVRRGSPVHKTR